MSPEGASEFDDSYQPSNIQKLSEKYLEDLGFDAHEIKQDALTGQKVNLSKYDIYKDKDTGDLWVYRKGGKGEGSPTHINID